MSITNETPQAKLARLLAEARAKKAAAESNIPTTNVTNEIKSNETITKTNNPVSAPSVPTAGNNNIPNNNSILASNSVGASKLAALKAKLSATVQEAKPKEIVNAVHNNSSSTVPTNSNHISDTNTLVSNNDLVGTNASTGAAIQYNEQQLSFINLAGKGESCVLIGAAGTGKTTCQRGAIESLIQSGLAGILDGGGHKSLPVSGTPGIVVVAFTRRAVANIRRNMPADMKGNCLTAHALLEYEPVYSEVIDETTGDTKKSMCFEPTRNAARPLTSTIKTCVIEESSMMSVELFNQLKEALPSNCQYIFLGDIQQLPPVFGSAILGYKMLELPTIELTTVYRQALESPIIKLAHRILSGKSIPATEYPEWKVTDKLTLHPWKKKLHPDLATLTLAKFLTTAIDNNVYDPEEDMVLMPFNKSFGTIEINKHVAQHLARKNKSLVWEIIAGFNKHYFSIGDKVLYEKEDATIINIVRNGSYTGTATAQASLTMDYWGFDSALNDGNDVDSGDEDVDFMLAQYSTLDSNDSEERVRQASHEITVRLADSDREVTLNSAADINSLLHSYALTVHKSQGSEFRKVFLILHNSHATMLQRELLYTAVTRAKEELYVICEPESFTNGILKQRIKGNTLAEKAEWFKGKLDNERTLS